MNADQEIQALKARIAELEAGRTAPQKANEIGPVALQKISENLERIKVNANNVNLTTQTESAIKTELQQINYSSWTAIKALEQDITER